MIDYDSHDWRSHLFDIEGSMVREILGRVMACVGWSAVVVLFHFLILPIGVPSTAHALVGLALGLLLVFRTNASYDRFWEGRRLWGSIVNESRNLARASRSALAGDPGRHAEVVDWTIAFAHASLRRLRDQPGLGNFPARDRLPAEATREVEAADHLPLAIASRITRLLYQARDQQRISDYVLISIDQNVQLLIDYLGGCERIHRTPLPFVYVVHLRRALILYCFTLPFALVREFGLTTIFDTFLVAYLFFGIEEIGVEIEDPFGLDVNDLPLERICQTIEANLTALRTPGEG